MKRIPLILVVILLISTSALSQTLGLPGQNGQLKFKFSDSNLTVMVDGITLIPDGNKEAFLEFNHGPHLIQVYTHTKNKVEKLLIEAVLFIPGGYLVETTYTKMGLVITNSTPIGGTTAGTGGSLKMQTTTTTSSTTFQISSSETGISAEITTSSGGTTGNMSSGTTSKSTTQQPRKKPALSNLLFISQEGMCEVYLDGILKAELDIPDIDEMSHATIKGIKPNTYLIRIESVGAVWYDGKITIDSGEEIKIRVEPGKFKIISRKPID